MDQVEKTDKEVFQEEKFIELDKDIDSEGYHTVYLYYFTDSQNLRIYDYFDFDRPVLLAEQKVDSLVINGLENGNSPPVFTDNYHHLLMRRKSYLVFALESSQQYNTSGNVTFAEVGNPGNRGQHTFQRLFGKSLRVELGGVERYINLICYRNEIERKPGSSWDVVGGRRAIEEYTITLPFPVAAGVRGPATGGTNMGPGVPPPAILLARLIELEQQFVA